MSNVISGLHCTLVQPRCRCSKVPIDSFHTTKHFGSSPCQMWCSDKFLYVTSHSINGCCKLVTSSFYHSVPPVYHSVPLFHHPVDGVGVGRRKSMKDKLLDAMAHLQVTPPPPPPSTTPTAGIPCRKHIY